jgi:hypothetical protein
MWITLLSQADQNGYVYGSPVGLARLASLDVSRAIEALDRLCQPDPFSQSKDEQGRRVAPETIEGRVCYRIVTYGFYRELKTKEERNRSNARRQRELRERRARQEAEAAGLLTSNDDSNKMSQIVTHPFASPSGSDLKEEEDLSSLAAKAIDRPFEWAYRKPVIDEAIATIWEGWLAFSGSKGRAPKTHKQALPFLEALATGRSPVEIRDALIKADLSCWARGKGPAAALSNIDGLAPPKLAESPKPVKVIE